MKIGTVALVGRTNSGKSSLVNALVGQKISITSPRPQTTRFPIYGVYEEPRGQILFLDTPGVFATNASKRRFEAVLEDSRPVDVEEIFRSEGADLLLYIVDPTRERGAEENKVLGIVRDQNIPKILVINKIDISDQSYRAQYKFLEQEFDRVIEVSATKNLNISTLLDSIFSYLQPGEQLFDRASLPIPALNLSSRIYIEEIIREKAFLFLRDEIPYALRVGLDVVEERDDGTTYIKAHIETLSSHYKKMIIGKNGSMIKEIGMASRKELELGSGHRVYLELQVIVKEGKT